MGLLIQASFIHGGLLLLAGRSKPPEGASRTLQMRQAGTARANLVPLQRGALNLAGSVGRPMPDAVRQKMESFFQTDFSQVRIHVGAQAQSIGAVAFTTGHDIFFAPGHYAPESARGQQLLGHELTHVIQQRTNRARVPAGSGMLVLNDPALEAEADRLGSQAAAFRTSPGVRQAASAQRTVRSDSGLQTKSTLQAKVTVGVSPHEEVVAYSWWSGVDAYWARLLPTLNARLSATPCIEPNDRHAARDWMKAKLLEWAKAPERNWGISARLGWWPQDRKYNDMDELARGLIGEFRQAHNHMLETRLAQQKAGDRRIQNNMVSLMQRLYRTIEKLERTNPGLERRINEVGSNWRWWKPWFSTTLQELKSPTPGWHLNFAYFRNACYKVESLVGGGARAYHYHDRRGRPKKNVGQYRHNEFNVIESHEFAEIAREGRAPIMSGPSATMARLLRVCEKIGATNAEIKALLWCGFIFHNQHFFSNYTATHTFHELFDVTAEFKIDKNLKYSVAKYQSYLRDVK
jgi:hypothetical protein